MFSRFGLRTRMAMSYVVISAIAVLAAEVVLLVLATSRVDSANNSAVQIGNSASQALSHAGQTRAKDTATATARIFGILRLRYPPRTPRSTGRRCLR